MITNTNKLYSIIFTGCIAGVAWLWLNVFQNIAAEKSSGICLFKKATHIPCPSCGSTRSILLFMNGKFIEAFFMNPTGILLAAFLLIVPVWILWDWMKNRKSFLHLYMKAESQLQKPKYAIPLILFVIINWIWNIKKGL